MAGLGVWVANARVSVGEQVPMPTQNGVRTDQQPQLTQRLPWQRVKQRGHQGPVRGRELDPLTIELPPEHINLVMQRKDLRVSVPVADRQQA